MNEVSRFDGTALMIVVPPVSCPGKEAIEAARSAFLVNLGIVDWGYTGAYRGYSGRTEELWGIRWENMYPLGVT